MMDKGRASVWLVDISCGCALAACVGAFLWVATVRREESLADVRRNRSLVESAQRDLATLHALRDEQRALRVRRSAELGKNGRLPVRSPVMEYMQTVSELATEHHLRLISNRPAAPRKYAGLFEERIECELGGRLPDMVRFLSAIEETDYWADIGYLKVTARPGTTDGASDQQKALLTFSLFSAPPGETKASNG